MLRAHFSAYEIESPGRRLVKVITIELACHLSDALVAQVRTRIEGRDRHGRFLWGSSLQGVTVKGAVEGVCVE